MFFLNFPLVDSFQKKEVKRVKSGNKQEGDGWGCCKEEHQNQKENCFLPLR